MSSSSVPPSVNCHHEGPNPNPHEACSSVYFMCHQDGDTWQEEIFHCHPGHVFNPAFLECDLPDDTAGCGDRFCRKEGLNPDSDDCGVYYYCEKEGGGWSLTSCHCSHDLVFDPLLEVCTWPDSVPGCGPQKGRWQTDQGWSDNTGETSSDNNTENIRPSDPLIPHY